MSWLEQRWYQNRPAPLWLWPLEQLYKKVVARRRAAYQSGQKKAYKAAVPVIVVGNITVGGTGKTPVVLWLIEYLRAAGYKPGVVSRGYGAKAPLYPYPVNNRTLPENGGDEPCMLARRTGCPMVIDPNRAAAARFLLEHYDCDLIISDDGLQHHALARDIELVVIDGSRGLGNRHCLPAGPLREPAERLKQVDFIIHNGQGVDDPNALMMKLQPAAFVSLHGKESVPVDQWQHKAVHAVAGIGNPTRFFDTLRQQDIRPIEHPFPDHHAYCVDDLCFADALPVVMTEKDAVKASRFKKINGWYLTVSAELPPEFGAALLNKLDMISHKVKHHG
ncbi:MAG: tetraacyldisaccharide 4'-kinase [Pontibacterium sp.]